MGQPATKHASLASLNIQEFRVLFFEGRLGLRSSRFFEIDVDNDWVPAVERGREADLIEHVPVFELEDENAVLWVVLETAPHSEDDRFVEITFSQVRALHALSERGQRRLRADFKETGLLIREPLFADAIEDLWLQRFVQMHLAGGVTLQSLVMPKTEASRGTRISDEVPAAVKARHQGVKFEEATGFFPILFCYERHDPFPPRIGSFLDFGKVVRAFLERNGCKEDPVLAGYRRFAKALLEEHRDEDCVDVMLSHGYWIQTYSILLSGLLPVHPDAVILFLDWKYQLEERGGFSLDPILYARRRLAARYFGQSIGVACYLSGSYWGFDSIAQLYHAEKMQDRSSLYRRDPRIPHG